MAELWDVLDAQGNKTGRLHERGKPLAQGDYMLIVHVWKHNGRGQWLIDKRAPRKQSDLDYMWETTGGCAIAGDDSLSAALREVKEELGLTLDPTKGRFFKRVTYADFFVDVWVFEHDCPLDDIVFQEGETNDARWATADDIREMMHRGEFLVEGRQGLFYPYFDEMVVWVEGETINKTGANLK
jgi:8-oxo-dGTP pyrophosphatase MutT (NUDIX family)